MMAGPTIDDHLLRRFFFWRRETDDALADLERSHGADVRMLFAAPEGLDRAAAMATANEWHAALAEDDPRKAQMLDYFVERLLGRVDSLEEMAPPAEDPDSLS